MSWFKIIKKDNSDDYKFPDDVKSFISDIENAYDESINIKDKMELAEYDSDAEDLEEVKQELEEFSYEVYKLGEELQVLITKYKIKDMNSSVKELEGNSPIPVQDMETDEVDYYNIIDELKEHFYVDPNEDKGEISKLRMPFGKQPQPQPQQQARQPQKVVMIVHEDKRDETANLLRQLATLGAIDSDISSKISGKTSANDKGEAVFYIKLL